MAVDQLSKHRSLGLTDEQVIEMYRFMTLGRKYDERAMILQRAGKVPFHVSGIGQEASQVAAAMAFRKNVDFFLPYYRDYSFVLSVGMTLRELMLQLFAKAEDPNSGGRQMPGRFGKRSLNIVTSSSPVTTQIPHAVGIALAGKMRNEDIVVFTSFGEGSSNQGDFHEGLNFAGVHKLPVVFFCENNQYAISVPYSQQVGEAKISDRALGYGFPGYRVDANDPLEVYHVVKQAHDRALRGEGPTLIECMSYRIEPHSTSDNDLLYRTKEEIDAHRKRDGIILFRQYLVDVGLWNDEQENAMLEQMKQEITDATNYADQASYPAPEDALLHVYAQETGRD